MRKRLGPWSALAVMLALITSVNVAQIDPKYPELPKFRTVNKNLYRGAQPKPGGVKKLAELGIKTIINLRDEGKEAQAEKTEAGAAGLRYFSIPMPKFNAPTDEQVARVLAIIEAPENQPVFVHSKDGANSTGLIIAVYRMVHDGWDNSRAAGEAEFLGMSMFQIKKKSYLSHYDASCRCSKPKSKDKSEKK